jgi:UDP-glucose 4-epimerase
MSILVTGAAGFVGCNLVDALLKTGNRVVGVDNLSRGRLAYLAPFQGRSDFAFEKVDIADDKAFAAVMDRFHAADPITEVWHMAANSDIPAGVADARVDLRDTYMTTFNILQEMKRLKIPLLAFASSSAIYGDLEGKTLVENIGPLFPISNYGAMKLASEVSISAAVEGHLERAYLFRFPNVIGTPATHGVVYDFIDRLRRDPSKLDVLGDGTQQKSYLHVEDLVDAMLFIRKNAKDKLNVFNVGTDDEGVTVRFIAEETVAVAAPGAKLVYGTGNKGWVGDVPRFRYSIDKLRKLGWSPREGSAGTMQRAIRQIAAQEFKA